jgi:hypothetical protein
MLTGIHLDLSSPMLRLARAASQPYRLTELRKSNSAKPLDLIA